MSLIKVYPAVLKAFLILQSPRGEVLVNLVGADGLKPLLPRNPESLAAWVRQRRDEMVLREAVTQD